MKKKHWFWQHEWQAVTSSSWFEPFCDQSEEKDLVILTNPNKSYSGGLKPSLDVAQTATKQDEIGETVTAVLYQCKCGKSKVQVLSGCWSLEQIKMGTVR